MKPTLKVFKIGGGILDAAPDLAEFLRQFAQLDGPKLLVHGGGKGASDMLEKLGQTPRLINGRRIMDAATLDIVTMFYAGKTNKQIVVMLQQLGVNALGISGADGNVIRAVKRPVREVDYGFVGDLSETSVNAQLIQKLLELELTLVLCPITHDGQGQLLNTNADTIAAAMSKALSDFYSVELHFCFEKNGVLSDINDERSVICEITPADYADLKQRGIIAAGMLPKLENAFDALNYGVEKVIIEHALHLDSDLRTELCLS